MARPSYGPQAKKQASRLLEALLTFANNDLEDCDYLKNKPLRRKRTEY